MEGVAEHYSQQGIILIGPFNCPPYRISEAILKPLCIQRGMPILSYESAGYAVEPSFLRQVDVHIQQVLDRTDRDCERPKGRHWRTRASSAVCCCKVAA
jgi:hypothetical protein